MRLSTSEAIKNKKRQGVILKKYILKTVVFLSVISMLFTAPRAESVNTCKHFEEPITKGSVTAIKEDLRVSSRIWELLRDKEEKEVLIPGGMVFGAKVRCAFVTVTDAGGLHSVKCGDKLISLDGVEIKEAEDVRGVLNNSGGKELVAVFLRGTTRFDVRLTPKLVGTEYRLGIQLRDSAAGIGTITYIDPETGCFGGLGHGIADSESGEVIEIAGGTVTGVILGGVKRGECGKPGELSGILTDKPYGDVYSNTPSGVFGKLNSIPRGAHTSVKIASRSEVHTGKAEIYSTIKNGKTAKYEIEITEVDTSSHGTKCFKIRVTDPTLIALTGGIVRGMSGSPIIQDGKLVGAVTHVLVANPTEGYGIFIENMLSAANEGALPKAA